MKITMKNFLFATGIIFIVTTLSLTLLYFIMPIYYEKIKENEIKIEMIKVREKVNHQSEETLKKTINDIWLKEPSDGLIIYIIDKDGKMISPNWLEKVQIGDSEEQSKVGTSDSYDLLVPVPLTSADSNPRKIIFEVTDSKGSKYTLIGEYSLQPVSDASRVLLQLYPLLLVVDLIIGGIAAYFYSRFSTKRIKEISFTTNQMLSLDYRVKCKIGGKDELAMLANDINQLDETLLNTIDALKEEVTKVAEVERSKAEFMRITSHELKTPITALMGIIDGMIYNVGKFKDREHYLVVCREILEQQIALIQNILTISKLDMVSENQELIESISLTQILNDSLGTFKILADAKQHQLSISLENDVVVRAAKDDMVKVFNNLLSNAVNYTNEQGQISIWLTKNKFIIENEAKPLSEDELNKIFDPFYRPDYSRNRESGGTGLGLFIVKQILDQYGWTFKFESTDKNKMRFTFVFHE